MVGRISKRRVVVKVDIDQFFAQWANLEPQLTAMLADWKAWKAAAVTAAASPIVIVAPVPEDKQIAKGYIEAGNLDAAGAAAGVARISLKTGHPFDETDDSYRRRVLAAVVGAGSVDAVDTAIVQGQSEAPATEASTPAPTPPIPASEEPAPRPILLSAPVAPIEPLVVAPVPPVVATSPTA
jgi:hypothetical protein